MAKGASKLTTGGTAAKTNSLFTQGTPADEQRGNTVVTAVQDVLNDFGFSDELKGVTYNAKGTINRGEANASMNGMGQLTISNDYLSKPIKPSNGYYVSDTDYGTGTHEAGHAVVNALLKNNVSINPDDKNKNPGRINLERATARSKGKLEKEVIKEAAKRYGSNPKISGYGSTSFVEKVAEAVSDVYTNKGKANPYSKTVVDVLKDIKKGKFNPVIKVSKREMGI